MAVFEGALRKPLHGDAIVKELHVAKAPRNQATNGRDEVKRDAQAVVDRALVVDAVSAVNEMMREALTGTCCESDEIGEKGVAMYSGKTGWRFVKTWYLSTWNWHSDKTWWRIVNIRYLNT